MSDKFVGESTMAFKSFVVSFAFVFCVSDKFLFLFDFFSVLMNCECNFNCVVVYVVCFSKFVDNLVYSASKFSFFMIVVVVLIGFFVDLSCN